METELNEKGQDERDRLRAELQDEFEEPEEPIKASPEDLLVEEEMPLTGKEEEWQQDMALRVKEWKRDTSTYPEGIQDAIRKIRLDKADQPDIELFHAFRQAQKSPSPFFRQKRDRLLRKRVRETQGDYESTGYQLTKILEVLSETE